MERVVVGGVIKPEGTCWLMKEKGLFFLTLSFTNSALAELAGDSR